eukprot:4403985-Alexandrium_andersonii.AAC.1
MQVDALKGKGKKDGGGEGSKGGETGKKGKETRTCHICQKPGHLARDFWYQDSDKNKGDHEGKRSVDAVSGGENSDQQAKKPAADTPPPAAQQAAKAIHGEGDPGWIFAVRG